MSLTHLSLKLLEQYIDKNLAFSFCFLTHPVVYLTKTRSRVIFNDCLRETFFKSPDKKYPKNESLRFALLVIAIRQDHLGRRGRLGIERTKGRRNGEKKPGVARGSLLSRKQEHSGGLMPTVSSISSREGRMGRYHLPFLFSIFQRRETKKKRKREKKRRN